MRTVGLELVHRKEIVDTGLFGSREVGNDTL
jgi:hypothetical protein